LTKYAAVEGTLKLCITS